MIDMICTGTEYMSRRNLLGNLLVLMRNNNCLILNSKFGGLSFVKLYQHVWVWVVVVQCVHTNNETSTLTQRK